ncbi:HAD family hydrolase [Chitinophagaceae bacterium LWZ2-11]
MQTIKNIIFDLGGIFLALDYKKTELAFADLGAPIENLYKQDFASALFEDLETGKITPDAFYDAFRKTTQSQLSDDQIRTAWNAMLLGFPIERLKWLEEIKTRYNVYLFSNTNQIHYDYLIPHFKKEIGVNFNDYFIKAYYSHELGLRKPYPNSYLKILEEQNLIASETLFIDDTYKNIEGATEAGLQTIYLTAPKTVLDLEL